MPPRSDGGSERVERGRRRLVACTSSSAGCPYRCSDRGSSRRGSSGTRCCVSEKSNGAAGVHLVDSRSRGRCCRPATTRADVASSASRRCTPGACRWPSVGVHSADQVAEPRAHRVGQLAERLLPPDARARCRCCRRRSCRVLVFFSLRGEYDPKKNSRSRTIGPPTEPPNSLWFSGDSSSWTKNAVLSPTGSSTSRSTGAALQGAALEVVVPLAAEHVAAALGHGADDAAERAAVFRRDAARLDLHFLQVLEDGVLARLAVDQAVGDDAVDGERVLRAARAVDLEAAFDLARVHRRRRHRDRLERAALRQAVELFGA